MPRNKWLVFGLDPGFQDKGAFLNIFSHDLWRFHHENILAYMCAPMIVYHYVCFNPDFKNIKLVSRLKYIERIVQHRSSFHTLLTIFKIKHGIRNSAIKTVEFDGRDHYTSKISSIYCIHARISSGLGPRRRIISLPSGALCKFSYWL